MRGEDFLPLLDGVKQTSENTYFARCPAHADGTASLSIRIEKDRTLFKCFGCGVDGTGVMEALKLPITDLFVNGNGHSAKLTLDSFAKVKQIPRQFLIDNDVGEGDGTLTFHHMLMDGRRAARHHKRNFLSGKGEKKFVWIGTQGAKFVPYGLWHVTRWRKEKLTDLFLCEGESDALTLWVHKRACLGLPGAQTTDSLQAQHIAGFDKIWIVQEPGEGGAQFAARMQGRLAVLRCRATVKIMQCGRYKDTSDLHCDGPEYFESRWIECQTAAEKVELEVAGFVLRKLSDIEEEKVEWLWPGRLPLAKLSLFAGDGGLGKSLVSQDIAAKLSRGTVWPDGRRGYPAGSTLILSSEDDAADTLKPRLRVAGADLDRIIIPEGLRMQSADGLLQDRSFNVRTDLGELEQALGSVPDVRLVILDPISGFMGATDGHKNTDVRGTLAPLCKIAQKYRCAILMLTHMNKGQGTPLHRIIDSVAFAAICRMAYAFAEDPENEGRVIFAPVKNNLGKRDSALSYAVEENHEGIAKVVWGSEAAINMTSVMAQNSAAALGRPPDKIKAAIELILELLKEGPQWAKYIYDRAAKDDIGRNTLLKAKDALGIKVYKDADRWMWTTDEE